MKFADLVRNNVGTQHMGGPSPVGPHLLLSLSAAGPSVFGYSR